MNSHFPSFDYSTIRDVELEFQYTSRGSSESGGIATLAVENIRSHLETATAISVEFGLAIAVDPRAELPAEWANFSKTDKLGIPGLAFAPGLPYFARLSQLSVVRVRLEAEFTQPVKSKTLKARLSVDGGPPGTEFELVPRRGAGGNLLTSWDEQSVESMAITWDIAELQAESRKWEITVPKGAAAKFKSLLVIIGYTLQ